MSYIGNSPVAGPINEIEQGDSSVEVIDTGTGRIEFTTDGTKVAEIDASGNMKFDSGYGSAETAYGCRAWVNFNGTGTVAIRDSGNVSSITDNSTGSYTVNFATAMPDANYSVSGSVSFDSVSWGNTFMLDATSYATTNFTFRSQDNDSDNHTSGGYPQRDALIACAQVFR
jgi:hypothetical protein